MMTDPCTADKAPSLACCLDQLRAFVVDAARNGLSFHDFESGLWQRLLQAGTAATQQFLDQQGPGDLGPSLTLPNGQPVRRLDDLHARDFTSVFGTFTLHRFCYGSREGQKIDFVPLDNRLALPQGKCSYLLQDFNQLLATEGPFAQVAATLERILGLEQHVDSLQRQNRQMAEQVEPFRELLPLPPAAEEGPILVRTADGKGIPMRRPADALPISDHDPKRGPKKDRKRQAIVGAVYSVAPWVRTPQEIVEALFRQPENAKPQRDRPRPAHKRVCARLNDYTDERGIDHDGVAEVFLWLARQVRDRNPLHDKVVVNVMDGEERLWEAKELLKGPGQNVDVLDLLHVTPRLWTAAGLLGPPGSKQAEQQVRQWLLEVLQGRVSGVIEDLRHKGEQARLSRQKRQELEKVCGYLQNHRERMRYNEYLKAGYPIASGVIEGACRHYVKDRMERTGMSWVKPGAQAMLELRSTALNGDWDQFMTFRIERETERLYPHRHTLDEFSWPMAG